MDSRRFPALAAYVDRIGAKELNFRRFMVKLYHGKTYYHEKCLISIGADGEVSVTNKDYAPTKAEADAIRSELVGADFPKHVHANEACLRDLEDEVPAGSQLYAFWSRKDGGLVMVQERAIINGEKAYIPWTYWSDGEWRRMEGDGKLPFWKPKTPTYRPKIMVHEGAKTAAFVSTLVDDDQGSRQDHPWGEELAGYEHWGAIGGALAPHRCDFEELRNERPTEVVYACDNDHAGKSALKIFSRHWGRRIKGLVPDEKFPAAWDLADPMPKTLFAGKRYIGPSMWSLTRMATWATEQTTPTKGAGRPTSTIKKEFVEEWCHCVEPEVYVHRDWPSQLYGQKEFNTRVSPYSDVDDTARLLKKDDASKTVSLKYSPADPPGIYADERGRVFLNTHQPSTIKAEAGDVGPWLDFVASLIPGEGDRREMLRWIATLIAQPDVKMLYGVLLISEAQGVGKGTLGERILAPLIGFDNTSYPSEGEIVDSDFNYWAAHKRLAVVHEIYAGHSSKAYNKLKSLVTDRYITVNRKYQAPYEIENWVHVFACSNSNRAIQLSVDDRRWFVPRITEKKRTPAYWAEINRWLIEDGGLGKIKSWAASFLLATPPVMRGDSAPWSEAKRDVVEDGFSSGMQLAARLFERVIEEANGAPTVIVDAHVVQLIRDVLYEGRHNDRVERPLTIRKVAKAKGWHVCEEKIKHVQWGEGVIGSRVLVNQLTLSRKTPTKIASEDGLRPVDVSSRARVYGMF